MTTHKEGQALPTVSSGSETGLPTHAAGGEKTVSLTDLAVEKTKALKESRPEWHDKHLRVYVEGGGCSGYSYGFKFDSKREGDNEVTIKDVVVLVDPMSLEYLKGCIIDYSDGLTGAGYQVQNPNASGTCGCGVSFSV